MHAMIARRAEYMKTMRARPVPVPELDVEEVNVPPRSSGPPPAQGAPTETTPADPTIEND